MSQKYAESFKKKLPPKAKPPGVVARYGPWVFVIVGGGLIVWMITTSKPEKTLVCNNAGSASLTSFGSCAAE